jgi:Zn-dependent peptidase ImmA (M78 family)
MLALEMLARKTMAPFGYFFLPEPPEERLPIPDFRTLGDRAIGRATDGSGILVVMNGVVGNNTRRKLDPQEFRGFVLCDRHAPLILINGADFKSAQMFTLAHELAHGWVNRDALFNLPDLDPGSSEVERFCNRGAAEVLIPTRELETVWPEVARAKEMEQRILLGELGANEAAERFGLPGASGSRWLGSGSPRCRRERNVRQW